VLVPLGINGEDDVSKSQDIEKLLSHLDKDSERYKKTKAYLEARARPGQVKTVKCRHKKDGMDTGVPDGEVTLTAGVCPCSICGHEFMWECHEEDCYCCSSVCT